MKKFVKPPVPHYIKFVIRIFSSKNPKFDGDVELGVQDIDNEEMIGGWSELFSNNPMKDTVREMIENRDKKIAKALCKHKKASVRFISAIILNDIDYKIDRKKWNG